MLKSLEDAIANYPPGPPVAFLRRVQERYAGMLKMLKDIEDAEFGYGLWPDHSEIKAMIHQAEDNGGT